MRERIRDENLRTLWDNYYRDARREVPIQKPKKDKPLEIVVALFGFCLFGIFIAWLVVIAMPIPTGQR